MLTTAAAIATLAFIVAGFLVGSRLLLSAARTRGLPEITMGLALMLLVGLGYPLMLAARAALGGDDPGVGARTLFALSSVCMNVGWMAVWVFTWRVFRRESPPAKLLACGALAVHLGLIAKVVVTASTLPASTLLEPRPSGTVLLLMAMAVYAWTGVEALRSWQQMRRRLALGLADPVATNRILLWAIVALFSMLSIVGPTVSALRGIDTTDDPLQRLTLAISGSVCAGALTLAFLPPARYLRWVRRRAEAGA